MLDPHVLCLGHKVLGVSSCFLELFQNVLLLVVALMGCHSNQCTGDNSLEGERGTPVAQAATDVLEVSKKL